MSWLALLLVGIGLTDLIFSVRPQKVVPEGVSAIAVVLLGCSAGLTTAPTWSPPGRRRRRAGLGLVRHPRLRRRVGGAAAGRPRRRADLAAARPRRDRDRRAAGGGSTRGRLAGCPCWPGCPPDRALLLLGLVLLQLSPATCWSGWCSPPPTPSTRRHGGHDRPALRLKGGRLLGPLERLLILGLGLAGEVTAASIVIAAKGLIRFPELQAERDHARGADAQRRRPGRAPASTRSPSTSWWAAS